MRLRAAGVTPVRCLHIETAHDAKERLEDRADAAKADADIKAAEANRDSIEKKNRLTE